MPRKVPWGVLCALGLLILVELGVARRDWFWRFIPRSSVGVVDAMERQVIQKATNPVVVILGNSRVRDAIAPRRLEEQLGLRPNEVLNLAITDGQPVDSLVLYRRNRRILSSARLLIVGFEVHRFNLPMQLTGRVQRFTTLTERFQWFADTPDLVQSVLGYFWRTYGNGPSIAGLINSWLARADVELPIGEDGRVVWRRTEEGIVSDEEDDLPHRVAKYYQHLDPCPVHRDQILRLIALAEEDNLQVVLLAVPVRDSMVDLALKEFPEAYQYCRNQTDALGDEFDFYLDYQRGSELGLHDGQFYDYGHMTPAATTVMTDSVANQLRQRFQELFESTARTD